MTSCSLTRIGGLLRVRVTGESHRSSYRSFAVSPRISLLSWEAVQEAREEGHEALDAAWQERWQRLAQAQAWPNLAQDLEALARQLDALDEEEGGTGRVRVQLWDRERDSGMSLS